MTKFGHRLFALACLVCGGAAVYADSDQAANDFRQKKQATQSEVKPSWVPAVIMHLPDHGESLAVSGLVAGRKVESLCEGSSWWIVRCASVEEAQNLNLTLKQSGLKETWVDQTIRMVKDQFVPNDPYFNPNQPASGWPGQWYLSNTFVSGRDLRVSNAWARNLTGATVFVGVVDDGFEFSHPELSPNYSSSNSYDFAGNDTNVFPVGVNDIHGTALTGLICGRGGNGVGITGVAPFAVWGGLRVDIENSSASTLISAILHRSSGTTTNLKIKNHSYGSLAPYQDTASQVAAIADSASVGTIHVRSAGNLRGSSGEDANKFLERNNVNTITISALGSDGLFSSYSNFGACVFACAPSNTVKANALSILSTDRMGEVNGFNGGGDTFPNADYTSIVDGTSVSAALATGVMALAKQVQPALDTRFAKHLLARTCTQVDASDTSVSSDGGWKTNAAALKFNQNYGFGLINADALTLEAVKWSGTTSQSSFVVPTTTVNSAIPDNNATGVTVSFNAPAGKPMEEAVITLNVTHPYRGDIEAILTSPRGTSSRLLIQAGADDGDNINWTLTSNAFWGEDPQGFWTLRVKDTFAGDTGTFNSYAAELRQGNLVRTISGTMMFNDWLVSPNGRIVNIELRPTGGGTPTTAAVTLGPNGEYSLQTGLTGSFDLSVKDGHWLRKTLGPVSLNSASLTGQNFTFTNGDVDGDNEIGPSDFSALAAAFGLTLGDPGYDANADLDGDDEVGPSDFSVLASHFGEVGDD